MAAMEADDRGRSAPSYQLAECSVCGKSFARRNSLHRVCSPRCAISTVKDQRKAEREQFKRRQEAAKPRQQLLKEAQAAFNRYVRLRDAGKPCICCGAEMNWSSTRPGGEIDAGHYMGTGASPELRFDEANVHAQRKSCNRPGGARRDVFRAGMVARVGAEEVWRLEGPQIPRKWTADDLRQIRDTYRAKAKGAKVD